MNNNSLAVSTQVMAHVTVSTDAISTQIPEIRAEQFNMKEDLCTFKAETVVRMGKLEADLQREKSFQQFRHCKT